MRIIVDTEEHCYEVLSLVHENFTVLSKEYDDYIANPKPNGYQSLHTVVTAPHGRPVEIQLRTRKKKNKSLPNKKKQRIGVIRKPAIRTRTREPKPKSSALPGCVSCWIGRAT